MNINVTLKNGKTRVHPYVLRWEYNPSNGSLGIYRMEVSTEKIVALYSATSWDYVEVSDNDSDSGKDKAKAVVFHG